ncbi:hypothetical protein GGI08_008899 [Coemansia sp. S2]|nr:hypothetical protein GGI08_008899 [Coemansia sp. S2]
MMDSSALVMPRSQILQSTSNANTYSPRSFTLLVARNRLCSVVDSEDTCASTWTVGPHRVSVALLMRTLVVRIPFVYTNIGREKS